MFCCVGYLTPSATPTDIQSYINHGSRDAAIAIADPNKAADCISSHAICSKLAMKKCPGSNAANTSTRQIHPQQPSPTWQATEDTQPRKVNPSGRRPRSYIELFPVACRCEQLGCISSFSSPQGLAFMAQPCLVGKTTRVAMSTTASARRSPSAALSSMVSQRSSFFFLGFEEACMWRTRLLLL